MKVVPVGPTCHFYSPNGEVPISSAPTTASNQIDYIEDFAEPFINRFNVAANAGVWIGITDGVAIDLRLYHTLTDINNNDGDRGLIDRATGVEVPRLRDDSDQPVGAQLSVVVNF